jgi:ribose transport system ATP-binding protein
MTVVSAEPVLSIRGLSKRFGAQVALAGIDLDLQPGEIHALLGENGAGKSTVIKILAGVIHHDEGTIDVLGQPLGRHRTHEETRHALAFVHQDLGLVETMSVAENVALVTGFARRRGLLSMRETRAEVKNLLNRFQIDVRPDAEVGSLDQDEKVMVAVARALSLDARIIVLDEVSASLPAPLMTRLASSLRQSRDAGAAYLYVTHRLAEVFDLADRVTVLRDGKVRATAMVNETHPEQLVDWIVGDLANAGAPAATRTIAGGPPTLSAAGLMADGLSQPLDLSIRHGEIVGICGLTGSGTKTVARLVAGAQAPNSGTATLDGRTLPLGNRAAMARDGVVYVPGDRQRAGTVQAMSLRENTYLRRGVFPGGLDSFFFRGREERLAAQGWTKAVGVQPSGRVDRPIAQLSGGNQQKVVMARALRTRPRLLVLEDPTAGVDVAARAELHRLVQDAAAEGSGVLLCSTDFEEVATNADRALVLYAGRIVAELVGAEITLDRLTSLSYHGRARQQRDETAGRLAEHEFTAAPEALRKAIS